MISASRSFVYAWSLGVAFIVFSGCGTVHVPVLVTHPAEINMAAYRQISISRIDGNLSRPFSDALKEHLVESNRFAVVDRTRLDQVMRELRLSHSDLAQSDKAAQLGNILPATAIITGHINGRYQEQLTHVDGTCKEKKREYKCREYTRTGTYTTDGSVDVIDVSTGQILKSKSLGNQYESRTSAVDKQPERIDVSDLASHTIYQNVIMFMKAITPWTEMVQAPFKTDGDIPALEVGVTKAKLGDMQGAANIFQTAARDAEMNPKIGHEEIAKAYWDLGLAYKYSSQFDKATEAFKKSHTLDPSQDCINAIASCNKLRAEKRKLDEQNR